MTDTPDLIFDDREPFDLEREPLDQSGFGERDWGGDGSDLHRPVRVHVLAALRPDEAPYMPPVDALLYLGDPRDNATIDQRRQALTLDQQHIPELIRMARSRNLYTADGNTLEVWAPLHAVAILSDLDVSAQIRELVPLLDLEDDWYDTALPELFGNTGEPALEPLRDYLFDQTRWVYGRANAANALEKIATQHPDLRDQIVAIFANLLRDAEQQDETVVTIAMDSLIELRAVETLPLIRHAFEIGKIDEMMRGAWGDVLGDLGLEPDPDDPLVAESQRRFQERHENFMPSADREQLRALLDQYARNQPAQTLGTTKNAAKTAQDKARKEKNKRKQASASRKTNRKKRK